MHTKKQDIIETATRLFAYQGYKGTPTRQIIRESGVSDPLLYYHFTSKNKLYLYVVKTAFAKYFSRLETLPAETATEGEKIDRLIRLHFELLREMPVEMQLIFVTAPVQAHNPKNVCTRNLQKQQKMLNAYLFKCLKSGQATGEFALVPPRMTTGLILGLLHGMVRQQALGGQTLKGIEKNMVAFCQRSLAA